MRKKLREIMDKEEGFTLVELLAVIVILGIILAIAIPSIGNVIQNSENKAKAADIELIKDAGRIYFTTDKQGIEQAKTGKATVLVTGTNSLVEKGYLELDVEKSGKEIHKSQTVTFTDGKVTYSVEPPAGY